MLNIDEVGEVHDRISQLVDYFCKGNKAAFGRRADIQSGVLAGITGGRKNKPSFEVMQRLLTAYPSVNPTWLLFGRGSMLYSEGRENVVDGASLPERFTLTPKQWEEAVELVVEKLSTDEGVRKAIVEGQVRGYVEAKARIEAEKKIYHIANEGANSSDAQLSSRLGISAEAAANLVISGKISSIYIDNEGHRVTERMVRKFLGEPLQDN